MVFRSENRRELDRKDGTDHRANAFSTAESASNNENTDETEGDLEENMDEVEKTGVNPFSKRENLKSRSEKMKQEQMKKDQEDAIRKEVMENMRLKNSKKAKEMRQRAEVHSLLLTSFQSSFSICNEGTKTTR